MACGPFFRVPVHPDTSRNGRIFQRHGFNLEADELIMLQLRKEPIQLTVFGPAIHAV
jgi:hypothetical protein